MNWKITQLGTLPAIVFAAEELARYLKMMDKKARVSIVARNIRHAEDENALTVGCDPSFSSLLPAVSDPQLDDAICIHVKNGCGILTGTNPRSVLIAVYRYLRELGCTFLRPGKDGEIIPSVQPETMPVSICEAASYRHREICIEGADSYEHVADMIDWIPKNAMNGYFTQFREPLEFFRRWYSHSGNPTMPPEAMSDAEISGIFQKIVGEIQKRGLLYHAVGHSWTCEPFGISGNGWSSTSSEVPDTIRPYLAEINGKREYWHGVPLNTNLCYSNPEVRDKITDSMTAYCETHPEIDFLHFWLADGTNNHCECENCKERPADYYVMMLNEADEKFRAKGIQTKIVFLIYVDLLWAPVQEKIKNPDRFVLMFAPITRTYSKSFTVSEEDVRAQTLPPYQKNHLQMPTSVAANIAHLQSWQKAFGEKKMDSFDFDYHFMWDHFRDPGSIVHAKLISDDMRNLKDIGLNGMNSCQCQRAFFPTSLGMITMADTLWKRESRFDDIARSYFSSAFGSDGIKVWRYLSALSEAFDPVYLRGEKPVLSDENARKFASVPGIVSNFMPVIARNIGHRSNPAVRKSWEYLLYHAQFCTIYAEALAFRADGMREDAKAKYEQLCSYLCQIEPEIHPAFDLCIFRSTTNSMFS